nr:arsenic resistance protein [Variovorax boronicumulans]
MPVLKDFLETRQPAIYFGAVLLGAALAFGVPGTSAWQPAIEPALALMLFLTFLQLPLSALARALRARRFITTLLGVNFIAVPSLVALLLPLLPADPVLRLGVLLVLLCPCIDYVVTFAQLGRADARLLLAATPWLLLLQMALLPLYLALLLGDAAAGLVRPGPFVQAFVWLIAVPLGLALACQRWAGMRVNATFALLPVPATALVLLLVVAAVLPQLGQAGIAALRAMPVYLVFALLAPPLGWWLAQRAQLPTPAARAVAFSAATRNSLVVLPLALAVPGALPLLPAVVVAQTLVELLAELVYVRWIPRWGRPKPP